MSKQVLPTAPSPTVTHFMNRDALIFPPPHLIFIKNPLDLSLSLHLWGNTTRINAPSYFQSGISSGARKTPRISVVYETLIEIANVREWEQVCDQRREMMDRIEREREREVAKVMAGNLCNWTVRTISSIQSNFPILLLLFIFSFHPSVNLFLWKMIICFS